MIFIISAVVLMNVISVYERLWLWPAVIELSEDSVGRGGRRGQIYSFSLHITYPKNFSLSKMYEYFDPSRTLLNMGLAQLRVC